jgi:hypothetical protein
VLSSLVLALGSFKLSVLPFFLPFWVLLNRKNWVRAITCFALFATLLNFPVLIHPNLFFDYVGNVLYRAEGSTYYLFQIYNYVWLYTLPLASIATLLSAKPALSVKWEDK